MYLDSSPKERLISPRPEDPNQDFWIPDKSTKSCSSCERAFNFFNRRHHCRICGHIFCSNCSFKREVEPLGIKKGSHHKEVIRVCEYCNGTLNDYITRVRESAVLIKKNIPQRPRGSLSELEFSELMHAKKVGRTDNLTIVPVVQEDDFNEEVKSQHIASRTMITESHSNYDGALLLGELEDQVEEEISFEMDDFLNDGRRKISPLEKALSMSQNIDPHSACLVFDYAEMHIKDAVRQIAIQEGIQDEWLSLLSEFTIKAVQNVKSSSRLLNDTMDFNHFVKIKRISWPDKSRSRFIHGVMATKNIADKRMASRINKPRILLISSPLQFYGGRNANKGYSAIESLIQQETYYLGILKRKIQLLKPDIICTECNASRIVLDQLRKEGVTIITNVKHSVMVFLARCTQTIILPSVDLIDKGVVLGTCERFYVSRNNNYRNPTYVKQREQTKSEPFFRSLVLTEEDIVKVDRSKIVFEGCNPILGCTLAISGPDLSELQRVKAVLRKAITYARNIVLERGYLLQCGLELPVTASEEKAKLDSQNSPFLGKHLNLLQNQKIILSQYKMALGHGKQVNESNETTEIVMPKLKNQTLTGAAGLLFQTSMNEMSESKIKEHLDKMCGKQKMERLYFYQGMDQPLGAFINEKITTAMNKCEVCKRPNHQHYRCLYMLSGRLKISLSVLKDLDSEQETTRRSSSSHNRSVITQTRFFNPLGNTGKNISREGRITSTAMRVGQAQHEANFREPIMTYNFCKICRRRVTPRETMNNEYYEYSLSCFLLQYFLNDKLILRARKDSSSGSPSPVRASQMCGHTGHRAIIRIFRQGHTFLKMDFQPKQRYQFQPLYLLPKPKVVQSTPEDAEMRLINEVITVGVTTFQRYMKHLRESIRREVEDLKRILTQEEALEALFIKEPQITLLNKLCKIIGELEEKTEKEAAKWSDVRKHAEKNLLQRVLLSHSLRYHVMLALRKFQLIVRQLVSCYLNVMCYAMEAQTRVLQRMGLETEERVWPFEESIKEKETILEMIELENFQMQNAPFSFLKTGSNGCFVSVDEHNWGSFLAYILVSDVYREVLASQNYFNLRHEVQNFPTNSPALFKGGVVINADKRKHIPSKEHISSHTSRRSTPEFEHPEPQPKNEGKTWYLHREEKSGKDIKEESKKVIPSSFDVFNGQSVKRSLVEDQMLKDTRVHMTFRFSCDRQALGVKINRDGISKSPFPPTLKVVSNSITNFNQLFTDTISPQMYHSLNNLLHEVDSWNVHIVERDLDIRLAEGPPESSRAKKTHYEDSLEKCQSVLSYGSSSPSRCLSPQTIERETEFIAICDEEERKEKRSSKDKDSKDKDSKEEVKKNPFIHEQLNTSFQSMSGIINTEPQKFHTSTRTIGHILSPRQHTMPVIPNLDLERANNNDLASRRKDSYFSGGGSQYRKGADFNRALREGENATVFELTVYYANKFEAMRRHYIGSIDEFVNSVAKSSSWSENSGGKSGSQFFITKDKRFIFKKIPKQEMSMFLSMGMSYFRHMAKHFFHRMPSLMAKTLGVYKLVIKDNDHSKKVFLKIYFILQENLFYQTHSESVIAYDLKGSEKRRYVKRGEEKLKPGVANNEEIKEEVEPKSVSKVLLDTNYQQDFNGEPIPVSSATKIYIEAALNNDSLMLSKVNVMDYSLLVILDTQNCILRAGIIDYMRQYTFDKMLEHSLKLVANAGLQPTITNPDLYKKRFQAACDTYFVGMFAKTAEQICNPQKQKEIQN